VALLLPALAAARETSRKAACISNLRQVGLAIQVYADYDGKIPYGPAPPFTNPAQFYPSTGSPTSLISLQSGAPVGLGLLLQSHLAYQPKVLFCPASDQPVDANAGARKVGSRQAQASYYYRHAGVVGCSRIPPIPRPIRLDNLGSIAMESPSAPSPLIRSSLSAGSRLVQHQNPNASPAEVQCPGQRRARCVTPEPGQPIRRGRAGLQHPA
jgi:hypothetical protein